MMGSPRQTQVTVSMLVVLQSVIRGNVGTTTLRTLNRLQPLPAPPIQAFPFFWMSLEQGEAIVFRMRPVLRMTACVHTSLENRSCFVNYFLKMGLGGGLLKRRLCLSPVQLPPGACSERLSALLCCVLP